MPLGGDGGKTGADRNLSKGPRSPRVKPSMRPRSLWGDLVLPSVTPQRERREEAVPEQLLQLLISLVRILSGREVNDRLAP